MAKVFLVARMFRWASASLVGNSEILPHDYRARVEVRLDSGWMLDEDGYAFPAAGFLPLEEWISENWDRSLFLVEGGDSQNMEFSRLRTVVWSQSPTPEVIARKLFEEASLLLPDDPQRIKISSVTVWESESYSVEYRRQNS